MADYRLAPAAESDLFNIAIYGLERFGLTQSESYRDALKARFQALAEHPYRSPAVDQIRKGYRRSVCGVHAIYYRVEERGITIMRILKQQDPAKAF